jgi:DNA adenine methylase
MKTPITYYGGKQKLAKVILSLIPEHICYVEPFFGGGAIFFAKEPSKVECINDINVFVINFYKVLKQNYNELKGMLDITLHSRQQYNEARNIYKNPIEYNDIQKAWSFWVLSQEAYGTKMLGGWGFGRGSNTKALNIKNKIDNFIEDYSDRLRLTQIECNDAIKVITNFDSEDAFFYLDPPYYNADMGPYKGYTIDDYKKLLETIAGIKGKFLLSSYPSQILEEYKNTNKWNQLEINKHIDMSSNLKETKRKTEVLTKNYKVKLLSICDSR